MKTRINLKAVVILAGSAAVLGLAIHFVHGFQVKRNAHALLEQADEVEREGRLARAADCLGLYLGLVPRDTDALARYGSLLTRLAQTTPDRVKAFLVLEQVLRRDRGRREVRRQAAELAMRLRRFADARDHLRPLLAADPRDPELLHLRASCEAGLGKLDRAAAWLERAIRLAPKQTDLAVEHAYFLRLRLQQPQRADEVINRLVRADAKSVPARLARARYWKAFGAPNRADADVRFALDRLGSQDAGLLLLAAELAQERGDSALARRYLERAGKLHPRDPRIHQALARREMELGHRRRALAHLQASVKDLPGQPEELRSLANLLIDLGAVDQARRVTERLSEKGSLAAVGCLRARLAMQRGQWARARQLLDQVRAQSPAAGLARDVFFLLGECYGRLANPDQQLAAYRRALEGDPFWLPARKGLAACLLGLGKTEQAVAEYRQLAAQAPAFRGELARVLLGRNLRLPAAQRRWEEVDRLLEGMKATGRAGREVRLLRAEVLLARDRLDDARRLLEAERDRDPKQVGPWLLLIRLADRQGRTAAIPALLEQAEKQAGPRVEWQLARARFWVKHDPAGARSRLRGLESTLKRFPAADRSQLLRGLAEAHAGLDDFAEARRLWRRFTRQQPADLGVRFLLLELAVQAGNEKEGRRLLGEIRRIEGRGGALTEYGEAALEVLRARRGRKTALAAARRHLAEAAALRPSWSRVPLLEAEIHELEHRTDRALEKYQAALDRGDTRLPVVRRVVQLLYEQGRYADANALIRKLPQRQLLASRDLGRLAAQLSLLGSGGEEVLDPEQARRRALRLARQTVAGKTTDYRDHLWLGQMAHLAGQPREAEQAFRRALSLARTNPEPWVTLLLFLARTDPKKAEAELAEARRALAPEQLPLVLATCYEALDRPKKAGAQYRAALAARPDDPVVLRNVAAFYERSGQPDRAEPLLRQLIDPRTKAPRATADWARRVLALALASRGGYARFREARRLCQARGELGEPSLEDRRVLALVLATQPSQRREAIRLLEGLAAHQASPPAEVRWLLARLYEAEGKWPVARGHLLALLKREEKNPVYLARYVRGLLSHGEAEEAREWVEKLAALRPEDFETVELRAAVLRATGKPAEAVRLLERCAGKQEARLDLIALLLDEHGQPRAAEKLYRRLVSRSTRPEHVLLLARFLARHQRIAEALSLCEKAWTSCAAEAVARSCVVILRAGPASAEQRRRVAGWLEAALEKQPRAVALLLALAEVQMGQGRPGEAVALYRRVLRQDRDNVIALNNLAFFVGLQEGKRSEALALINRALAVAGPDAELLDTRAVLYLSGEQPEQALQDLQQAIGQAPSAGKYFHLAQAHLQAKNRSAARLAYHKALQLGLRPANLGPLERRPLAQLVREFGSRQPTP
jgi:tetratricopeptide (TPR) repeat protein